MKIKEQGKRWADRGKSRAEMRPNLRAVPEEALEKELARRLAARNRSADAANKRAALKNGDMGD